MGVAPRGYVTLVLSEPQRTRIFLREGRSSSYSPRSDTMPTRRRAVSSDDEVGYHFASWFTAGLRGWGLSFVIEEDLSLRFLLWTFIVELRCYLCWWYGIVCLCGRAALTSILPGRFFFSRRL